HALLQVGHAVAAVPHLRQAVAGNPFDPEAARELFQALNESEDALGASRLARDRCLLARAAPDVLPTEAWFAEPFPPEKQRGQDGGSSAARQSSTRFHQITLDDFRRHFGTLDTTRAIHSFTRPGDTNVVLTLLAYARPRRIVEIGTALGHMTANLTEWSPDEAVITTVGIVADLQAPTEQPQRYETPDRASFGCF